MNFTTLRCQKAEKYQVKLPTNDENVAKKLQKVSIYLKFETHILII